MLALTLSGTFIRGVTISTIARLLAYAVTCAGMLMLRRREHELPAQFKTPLGVVVVVAALALIGWLLAHSTGREARDSAIAAIAGLVIYWAYKMAKRPIEQTS
jgi:amino acid transporter